MLPDASIVFSDIQKSFYIFIAVLELLYYKTFWIVKF